jgi:phage protein D
MGLGVAVSVGGSQDAQLSAASSVEVVEAMGEATTYCLRYELDAAKGDLPLLFDGRLDPGSVLSIFALGKSAPHCLVKGPVHGQRIGLRHGVAGSWVEVRGSDTSVVLDRESKSTIWPKETDSEAAEAILRTRGYKQRDIAKTNGVHDEKKHTLVQRESDLRFVRRLARRNGFLFWIDCDEAGKETAHFRRPALTPGATPPLVINLQGANLGDLEIAWDVERPTRVDALQLDLNAKTVLSAAVAATPLKILGDKGLKAITGGDARSIVLQAPVDDTGDLRARAEGALIEADWFIQAVCTTSRHALGDLVRAHTVVELKGAGKRHSGTYFVAGVRHVIDAAAHQMEIELIRNGWGA